MAMRRAQHTNCAIYYPLLFGLILGFAVAKIAIFGDTIQRCY